MIFSEYTIATGVFTGRRIWGSPEQLPANVADGCSIAPGEFNADTQEIDHATGIVSALQSAALARYAADPRPERPWMRWDRATGQWIDPRSPEERLRQDQLRDRAAARARIQELEGRQHRAIREALLTGDTSRLRAIEDEIALLRPVLSSGDS